MKLRTAVFLSLAALFAQGCGEPSYEEQEATRKADRQQKLETAKESLAAFASKHSATPFDLSQAAATSGGITVRLQDKLEGNVIAIRSNLVDIHRQSPTEYQLFFGNLFFGGILVVLSADQQLSDEILKGYSREHSEYLVVAEVSRVTPIVLEASSCGKPDCRELELRTDLLHHSYRLSGKATYVVRVE